DSRFKTLQQNPRTNRLFDRSKQFGQVVTFQTPALFEEKVSEALFLYSNGGENAVLAPTFEEAHVAFKEAVAALRDVAVMPDAVDSLTDAQKKRFAKAFQRLDKTFAAIQVYSEFEEADLERDYQICGEEIAHYHGKYVNVLEEIKENMDSEQPEPLVIDIAGSVAKF
ncbi:hypothetical protein HMPREF1376_00712, partial [Enterococcus faecium R446]|uniref:type I restriction endonuclease subunit R, EcoR124 family n=1 Tax=Enterococcus faecium TaxID=1352 RepID=UPI00028262D9